MTTEQATRPKSKQVRIDNCSSVRIVEAPSINCQHGKLWRTTASKFRTAKERAEFCSAEECAATEYTPQAGHFIVLEIPRTYATRERINLLFDSYQIKRSDGGTQGAASEREQAELLREIVCDAVISWDWTDADGNKLSLPSVDWEEVTHGLDFPELLWIAQAVYFGDDPDVAMGARGNGSAG